MSLVILSFGYGVHTYVSGCEYAVSIGSHGPNTVLLLSKKSLRSAEPISALNNRRVCLASVDKPFTRYKKRLLFLLLIALQSGLLVAFGIWCFFGKPNLSTITLHICNFEMMLLNRYPPMKNTKLHCVIIYWISFPNYEF